MFRFIEFYLVTLVLSNFSIFSLIFILSKSKAHLFYNASFLYWISCACLSLCYSLILSFSSFDKAHLFFNASFLYRISCSYLSLCYSLILSFSSFDKAHLFCNASFLYWISCSYLSLCYSLILSFSSFDKFLYQFFVFSFIASLFCK